MIVSCYVPALSCKYINFDSDHIKTNLRCGNVSTLEPLESFISVHHYVSLKMNLSASASETLYAS